MFQCSVYVLFRVAQVGLVLRAQQGHQEKDFRDQRYVPFLFLIDNYHLLPSVDTQGGKCMRLFQGEQGPQGVLGPRGLPGEGFPGAKVSHHRVSDIGTVFVFYVLMCKLIFAV